MVVCRTPPTFSVLLTGRLDSGRTFRYRERERGRERFFEECHHLGMDGEGSLVYGILLYCSSLPCPMITVPPPGSRLSNVRSGLGFAPARPSGLAQPIEEEDFLRLKA